MDEPNVIKPNIHIHLNWLFWLILAFAGEPDLIDALIQLILKFAK